MAEEEITTAFVYGRDSEDYGLQVSRSPVCSYQARRNRNVFFSSSFGGKIVSTMPMASFTPREARTNSGGAC